MTAKKWFVCSVSLCRPFPPSLSEFSDASPLLKMAPTRSPLYSFTRSPLNHTCYILGSKRRSLLPPVARASPPSSDFLLTLGNTNSFPENEGTVVAVAVAVAVARTYSKLAGPDNVGETKDSGSHRTCNLCQRVVSSPPPMMLFPFPLSVR